MLISNLGSILLTTAVQYKVFSSKKQHCGNFYTKHTLNCGSLTSTFNILLELH